jgi:enoyl-CoA hydratase/carnithine racemase
MPEVELDVAGGIASLRLNRPQRRNAMTIAMTDEVAALVERCRTDPEVRVIVLRAAGDAFCSGVDLDFLEPGERGLSASPLELKRILTDHVQRIALAVEDVGKPVIAAVNGAAVGAGMDLALMCDIRFAGTSARFSETYVRIGLVPGAGGCHLLPALVGRAKAMELLLGGEFVDAAEAHRIGLVNRVVPDHELEAEVDAFAARVAAASPLAVTTIRQATRQADACDLRTSLAMISSHLGVIASTADASEALAAAREKRAPIFTGS